MGKKGLMRRSLDHITVTLRCIAQKSISLLGFPATTFPFRAPSGITTAGNVQIKKKDTTEDSQYAIHHESWVLQAKKL